MFGQCEVEQKNKNDKGQTVEIAKLKKRKMSFQSKEVLGANNKKNNNEKTRRCQNRKNIQRKQKTV